MIDTVDLKRALALQAKQDNGEVLTPEDKDWLKATIKKYGG